MAKTKEKPSSEAIKGLDKALQKEEFVDFDYPKLYNHTIPLTCSINGSNIILDKHNWSSLLVAITEYFIEQKNPFIVNLSKTPVYGKRAFFLTQKPYSGACRMLSNNMWIFIGYNPQIIVKMIKNLFKHCGIDTDNVIITFEKKKEKTIKKKRTKKIKHKTATQNDSFFFQETVSHIDEEVRAVIFTILEEFFPNGIRYSSIIDINKLKKYYNDATGKNLQDIGVKIESILQAAGIFHGEKVYAIPPAGKLHLKEFFEKLISDGHRLFYYEELHKAYPELMHEIHIFTPDLLRTVLRNLPLKLYYNKHLCKTENVINVETEILHCYETYSMLSWEEVKIKLPFVPLRKIKHVVVYNENLVKTSRGVYAHISTIAIDDNDVHNALKIIEKEISIHDYASLTSLDISASIELNPGLSEFAIKNVLFINFFADHFEKRGKIIMQKGKKPKLSLVLKEFCLSKKNMKLKELLHFEKDIRGHQSPMSLEVAYNNMVRINKSTFTADENLKFDIESIDNALELFVTEKVIPIRAVSSFTSFSDVDGFTWNLFLLESFCRRFSKKFSFVSQLPNSRNIGAIFLKDADFSDLIDVLAYAVLISSVNLSEELVSEYLINNQYIGKRTSIISNVIEKTHILKEKRI
jgi:hypothetical protein